MTRVDLMAGRWALRIAIVCGWFMGVTMSCLALAIPAPRSDLAFLLLVEGVWVGLLLVGDLYLFFYRHRFLRPDYLALAVAIWAFTYGGIQSQRGASFVAFGMAILTTGFGVSLWLRRETWATARGTR